jgi:polysaccharide deacetylase 2 family uncharacterized protein YibQ
MRLFVITPKVLKRVYLGAIACVALVVAVCLFCYDPTFRDDVFVSTNAQVQTEGKPRLAIVIDDFGGADRSGIAEMLALPVKVTPAIMPFEEHSADDARLAQEKGLDTIMHMAMEPMKGKRSWLGPNPIMNDMSPEEVTKILQAAFETTPGVVGMNNHTGSKASGNPEIMRAVMAVLKDKNMFFLDSMTSGEHVAMGLSQEFGVPVLERNVFLEENHSVDFTRKQLAKAADIAVKNGYAIAIGHVGAEGGVSTAQCIKDATAMFEEKGVEIVSLSDLFK